MKGPQTRMVANEKTPLHQTKNKFICGIIGDYEFNEYITGTLQRIKIVSVKNDLK